MAVAGWRRGGGGTGQWPEARQQWQCYFAAVFSARSEFYSLFRAQAASLHEPYLTLGTKPE